MRCRACKSIDTIKWGKRKNKQRYKCNNCDILFSSENKSVSSSNRFIWFKKWVIGRQIIEQISKKSKYSKRTYLDIASVNTAVSYKLANSVIEDIHISGGGIAPVPKYFEKTRIFLKGKELNETNLQKAGNILLSEVSPISDIRGSKEYKSLLLKQLFFAHFNQ